MIIVSLALFAIIAGGLGAAVVDGVRNAPRQVSITSASAGPPGAARAWVSSSFVPALRRARYRVAHADDGATVLQRAYWPPYVWLVGVLLFPLGLLAFVLGRQRLTLTVSVEPRPDGGADVLICGEAPGRIAKRLDTLR